MSVAPAVLPTPAHEPDPAVPTFAELGVSAEVLETLDPSGHHHADSGPGAVIPDAIAGRDVLGRARTGSGKTLAFGLPILARLAGGRSRPKQPARAGHRADPRARQPGASRARAAGARASAQARHRLRRHAVRPADQAAAARASTSSSPRRAASHDLMRPRRLPHSTGSRSSSSTRPTTCATSASTRPSTRWSKQTPATGQRMLLSATLDGDVDRLVRAHLCRPGAPRARPQRGRARARWTTTCWSSSHSTTRSADGARTAARPTRARSSSPVPATAPSELARRPDHGRRRRPSTCTATCRSGCASGTCASSPPARPTWSSPPTSPPAASTSTASGWSCTTTRRRGEGLPAPLRAYGARRGLRRGRHHDHAAAGRPGRADAADGGGGVAAPRRSAPPRTR